jgi:rubrerythrin
MKLYRCQICGDPYLGSASPTNCPFCGAPQKYIVLAEDYQDRNDIPDLSSRSRENLEKALELEVKNSGFYLCAAACSSDPVAQAMFKALAKIEAEHAATIVKMLKIPKPEIKPDPQACQKDPKANFAAAHEREQRAVAFYRQGAAEATEDRVRQVFNALVEIESDHIQISETRK